jgi:hypothetical protein
MANLNLIQGSDKSIVIGLKVAGSLDPIDLTTTDSIVVCFSQAGSHDYEKKRVLLNGDILSTSPIVSNTDTKDLAIGDLVTAVGVPSGAKVLTIDSDTQFTMDQNASMTTVGVDIVVGDVTIVGNPLLGKLQIDITAAESEGLAEGTYTIECKKVDTGKTQIIEFTDTLDVASRQC